MDDFLQALVSGGVVPFTALLITAVLYWLLVILGALDLDILHFHHEAGHHGGHAGHHGDHDGGDSHHAGWFSGFLEFLSVGKVPLTIICSLIVFIGWAVAMLLTLLGLWWLLVLPAALAVALPVTGLACRPLRALFTSLDQGASSGMSLRGREARITSATCDATFGTATCSVDGAEVMLRVVAVRPELVFKRNDVVVIADHDAERDAYLVGPADYLRPPAEQRQSDSRAAVPPPALADAPPPLAIPPVVEPLTESSSSSNPDAPQRRPLSQ